MRAHDILRSQVRTTVNMLYIAVFCILPVLWFGECKNALSLVFKNIKDSSDNEIAVYYFSPCFQILFVAIGIGLYSVHHCWRLQLQEQRNEILTPNPAFTKPCKFCAMKQKILYAVKKVGEEKLSVPLNQATSDIKPMQHLRTMNCEDFNKQMEIIEKETRERATSSNVQSGRAKIPKMRNPLVASRRRSKSNK